MSNYDKVAKYLKERYMQNESDEECYLAAKRLCDVYLILHKEKKRQQAAKYSNSDSISK